MRKNVSLLLGSTLLAASLGAQTTSYIAPSGYNTMSGGQGNTIPWWAGSATYQQVHDSSDLAKVFPAAVAIIKGLSWRPSGSVPARTIDAQVTLGATPVTAQSASTTFVNNLGASPSVVLNYTTISLPALAGGGNPPPQGWFVMFTTPFIYAIPSGNLCYELRFKNSSVNTTASFDAVSGSSATFPALIGSGCTATGQTAPATISTRTLNMGTGAFVHKLDRAFASTPAVMFMGDTASHIVLPGFCSAVETLPIVSLSGATDSLGSWNLTLTFGSLYGFPRVTIYSQFAFLDAGLPNGVGLSPCSPVALPPNSIARIYYGNYQTGQGNELGTVGSRETYPYGLVTGFEQ